MVLCGYRNPQTKSQLHCRFLCNCSQYLLLAIYLPAIISEDPQYGIYNTDNTIRIPQYGFYNTDISQSSQYGFHNTDITMRLLQYGFYNADIYPRITIRISQYGYFPQDSQSGFYSTDTSSRIHKRIYVIQDAQYCHRCSEPEVAVTHPQKDCHNDNIYFTFHFRLLTAEIGNRKHYPANNIGQRPDKAMLYRQHCSQSHGHHSRGLSTPAHGSLARTAPNEGFQRLALLRIY
jgi:hypothetical protein